MTSVGVMASAVVVSAGVDVLLENFTSVAEWTGTISSVAGGRTGNAGQIGGSSNASFAIPGANESATVTIGFAFKISSLAAIRTFLQLASDTAATTHETFQVNTNGSIVVKAGGAAGPDIGTTAAGLIAINTWNYFEAQVTMSDTVGAVLLRLNGTERLNLSNVDTKAGGTKTVFDSVRLSAGGSGTTHTFDDMYITTGAGAAFKGNITVP